MKATAGLVIFAIFAVISGMAEPRTPSRIIGGELTTIDRYPYAAVVLLSYNLVSFSQSCGGTIVSDRAILSAAHCFWERETQQFRVRVGSSFAHSGGSVHNAANIISHPHYVRGTYENDVAIIRLATRISLNNNAQIANLAAPGYNLPDNAPVWAIGWGMTFVHGLKSEQLRHVELLTINQDVCVARYRPLLVDRNMLCAGWLDVGGRDQCQNDSGAPVIHNGVVVGVCSWGRGCARPDFPGVNQRVSGFNSWIRANA